MPLYFFNVQRNGVDDPLDIGHRFASKEGAIKEACRAIADSCLECFEQVDGEVEITILDADKHPIASLALKTTKKLF